jgi:predicted transcriptional regulator
MSDADTVLRLVQNDVRRRILARLVREPHYPMQLAELLEVSQPAINKHLKELEAGGLVTKEQVPSEKGGPPRRVYSVTEAVSVRIDLGPDLFSVERRALPKGGPMRLSANLPEDAKPVAEAVSGRKKIAVGEGLGYLRSLSASLADLDRQRDAIIALHQQIRGRISAAVDADFEDYDDRALLHHLIEAPTERFDALAVGEVLGLGRQEAAQLVDEISARLERQLADRAGHVIATRAEDHFRWWLGGYRRR